jgi:mannose-6-phosphate isomerase
MRNSNRITKYPVKMSPVFKDYLWGGNRLNKEWNKNSPYAVTAESWELASHTNGQSKAASGPLEGLTLDEVVQIFGPSCLGEHAAKKERFPVLVKLIDSEMKLSIQVHPDDIYAMEHEQDQGKTEMWYIADADLNSYIYCGFKKDMTREALLSSIRTHTITDCLNKIPVQKGQVFFISPGTIHAIGEGLVIAEIQQNSDITYRVYDYNRKGPDGSSRPLHIDHALQVTRLTRDHFSGNPLGSRKIGEGCYETLLAECVYFRVCKYDVEDTLAIKPTAKSFQAILIVEGCGNLCHEQTHTPFRRGDCFFIPSGMSSYTVEGICSLLMTEI